MRKNTVFTAFLNGEEEIDFLPVDGTTVKGQRKIKALMKFKAGLKHASQLRRTASDLTIHAHPNDFDDVANPQDIIGSAVRWKGRNYSIDGVSIGKNYDTGEVEHLTFNCSLAIYSDERPKFCLERDRAKFLVTETGRMFMLEQFKETV